MLLVFLAAVAWSLGGTIARFISVVDPWTVIFLAVGLGRALPHRVSLLAA